MPWPCALGNLLCRTSVLPAVECSSRNTRGIWGGTTHPGRRLAQSCRAFSLLAPACRNTSCWDSQKYSMLSPGCPQVENHKFTFIRNGPRRVGPGVGRCWLGQGVNSEGQPPSQGQARSPEVWLSGAQPPPGGPWNWRSKGRSRRLKPSPRGAYKQSVRP